MIPSPEYRKGMTGMTEGSERHNLVPLHFFDPTADADERIDVSMDVIPNKCVWKCASACYHDAPNEDAGRTEQSFASILARRVGRRGLLKGAAAVTVPLVAGAVLGESVLSPQVASAQTAPTATPTPTATPAPAPAKPAKSGKTLGFQPIALTLDDKVTIPQGYTQQVLLRYGDPITPGTPRMTMANVSPDLAKRTFGYNCDLNVWFPTQMRGDRDFRGLLFVNHEYTEGQRMFATYDPKNPTAAQVDVELAAHGGTIVELERTGTEWSVVMASPYNRRINALDSVCEITGPLRGDARLRTSADSTGGGRVIGMLNNCAGGKTPWGTVLTGEENFNQYFANNDKHPDAKQLAANKRYGIPAGASQRSWEKIHSRFDVAKEPNEVNRHGYVVEIDPFDPTFVPKKRSAMGRFKHEGADAAITRDGRVAFYSGDDERFDYLYKFITSGRYNPNDRAGAMNLLDSGTLYVAKYNDDGTGTWIALDPSTPALATWSIQDILLNTRLAADAVKATPMDRPEDVQVNPRNNKIYMALTNNTSRKADQVNQVNPRAENRYGHVIEMSELGGDSAAMSFTWEIFLICGDPSDATTYYAGFSKAEVSTISCPDNVAFDQLGNLWIATDGQPGTIRKNDAVYGVPVDGPDRGRVQPFLTVPTGAEVCGPEFTSDNTSLFVNVQHPGEEGTGPDKPQSVWPDGVWPPLPSLVVISKADGGRIGS